MLWYREESCWFLNIDSGATSKKKVKPVRHCHEHLFLAGGSDIVTNIFASKGSQYNDYGEIQLHRPLIVEDARPNIVDAPLTIIFRRWQQYAQYSFCL